MPLLNDDSLQNCLMLLRAVWQNEHDQVYRILRHLPWRDLLRPLIHRYESMNKILIMHGWMDADTIFNVVYFQQKTFDQVSGAYETIRPETVAWYLGLDLGGNESRLIEKLTSCGWIWNGGSGLFHPKRATAVPPQPPLPVDDRPLSKLSQVMALAGGFV